MKPFMTLLMWLLWLSCAQTGTAGTSDALEGAPMVLTLEQAVALASEQNRQIQIDLLDVTQAKEAMAQAKTAYLPKVNVQVMEGMLMNDLDFTIPKGTLGTYSMLGPLPQQDSTVTTEAGNTGVLYGTVAQPLLQLYKVHLGVEALDLKRELAEETVRGNRIVTLRQVKQTYCQIAQLGSRIAGAQSMLTYLLDLAKHMERNLAQQTVLREDSLAVKARFTQQDYQVLVLRHGLKAQKEALNRLLGRDLHTPFTVQVLPLPAADGMDLKEAEERALCQRSEIRQADLKGKLAEASIRRTRADYLPDLNLQFSYLVQHDIAFVPRDAYFVGLSLQWEPVDWGKKSHQIKEHRAALEQARLALADAAEQIRTEVGIRHRNLTEARTLVDVHRALRELEEEKLRTVTNRYLQQSALFSDLLSQQASVSQAEAQYQKAVSDFWSARAAFDQAIGEE